MKSWEDVAPEPLSFPIGGKVYTIPELPYTSMLTLQKIKAGEPTEYDDAKPEDTWRLVMGSAWDEMTADNVPGEAIGRAGLATLAYFEQGPDVAEAIWEHGIDPKALAEQILAKSGLLAPSSTAAATETPSPASTSGTSSRPTSSKKPRRKATAKASPSSSS
jgi:hypothetical protein